MIKAKKYENLKELVYDQMKNMIITGVYKPNTHLNEKKLTEELKTSRTPFREAMNRLELEGFVKIIPRKGFFVAAVKIKTINDIFGARELMEPQLIESGYNLIDKEFLLKLKEKLLNWENLTQDDLDELDWELHYHILKASNNSFLIKSISNLYEHNQRFRTLVVRDEERVEETTKEHLELINALLKGDIETAKKASINHSRSSLFDSLGTFSATKF